jgi:hypothetical protein
MTVEALRPSARAHGAAGMTALALAVAGIALAVSVATPSATGATKIGAAAMAIAMVWMAVSRKYHLSLALLLLWLGLFDGYVRLKTGDSQLTLLRDALLYAIVIGWLVRASVHGDPVRLPPLSGWVIAFVAVVLVQLLNPAGASLGHSVASLRPHLEWIPLFFLGYAVMRTRRRLRLFLLLLLAVTVVNALVAAYQSRLTPDALAAWGPGYAERIQGTGDVSGRLGFASNAAQTPFVRPFGLGSDIGFSGAVGALAAPAALALIALSRRPRAQLGAVALATGVVAAVATSQSRTQVLAAFAAVVAFLALATVSGRIRRALPAVLAVGVVAVAIGPQIASIGGFNRYESITPGRALQTTYEYRKESFSKLPGYVRDFPLGAGLGSVGPAGGLVENVKDLDAENELNFLVIELGVPGLLVYVLFNLRLFALIPAGLRRVADSELRLLLAAVAAPLFGIFLSWIVGVATATSPFSPYFWFAAGTLSYWLFRNGRGSTRSASAQPG